MIDMSGDEKIGNKQVQKFIKRVALGIVIFLVPFIVRLFMRILDRLFDDSNENFMSWYDCWEAVRKDDSTYFNGCDDIYGENLTGECIDEEGNFVNLSQSKCVSPYSWKEYDKGQCSYKDDNDVTKFVRTTEKECMNKYHGSFTKTQ